jgi:hypothetical protein
MSDTSLLEAFASYKARPAARSRSAIREDGTLVMSCWYSRFHRADAGVLRYEEDLSSETENASKTLHAHLAQALADQAEIQLIVAVAPSTSLPQADASSRVAERPKQTTFHARKDLVGRLTFYDGKKFIIEFRRRDS